MRFANAGRAQGSLDDARRSIVVARFESGDCSYVDAALALARLPARARLDRSALCHINGALRELDQSHLLPINSRFNGTDRAIRRVAPARDGCEDVVSYICAVERELARIVNA